MNAPRNQQLIALAVQELPIEEKLEVSAALLLSPQLVERESHWSWFLSQGSTSAGRAIANYWTLRKRIFGHGCYKTMTLEGALCDCLTDFLLGAVSVVPTGDSSQCVTVFVDRSVRVPQSSLDKIWFYVCQLAMEAQKEVIILSWGEELVSLDNSMSIAVLTHLPVTIASMHFFCPPSGDPYRQLAQFGALMVRTFDTQLARRAVLHTQQPSITAMRGKLQAMGYRTHDLPQGLGGTFDAARFRSWIHERILIEQHQRSQLPVSAMSPPCQARPMSSLHRGGLQFPCDRPVRFLPSHTLPGRDIQPVYRQSQEHYQSPATSQLRRGRVANRNTAPAVDLQGSNCNAAVAALKLALELYPNHVKRHYTEATLRCPGLVEIEASLLKFLQVESFDVQKSSVRVLSYWDARKDLFGDRALFAMVNTGRGALTKDDGICLSSGVSVIALPDASDRPVVVIDRTRALDPSDVGNLRALFYILHVLSSNEQCRTEGVVLIDSGVSSRTVDHDITDGVVKLLDACPVKVAAYHIVNCPPKTGKKRLLKARVASMYEILQGSLGDRVISHFSDSPDRILEQLSSHGLSSKGLPPLFGGTWKYEQFTQWKRQQRDVELRKISSKGASLPSAQPGSDSDNDEKTRRRKMNTIHSRQKRERRRAESDQLVKRVEELKSINAALVSESERLLELLQLARERTAALKY